MRILVTFALVALIAAACGDVDVSSEGGVEILTSSPEVSMTALGSFVLQYDEELNCLYHDEPSNNGEPGTGGRIVIVWPDGYSAVERNGEVDVLDASGGVVATTGAEFQLGGGMVAGESHCDAIGAWVTTDAPVDPDR